MKTALITGATSGFGHAIALRLAGLGYNLIVTGRRAERLEELTKQLQSDYSVKVISLCFDVRDNSACTEAINSLPPAFQKIDVLINNAGLAAGASPFQESDLADYEKMIDTNVKGLLYMTKLVVPGMIEQQSGLIINLSSIAGIEVYPNGSVYCASKHAVNAITKGLRLDLVKHGIKVSSVSPGMAETEFSIIRYHGDEEKAKAVYAGLIPLSAEDIADTIEFIVTRPAHVSINDIQINPAQQANTYIAHRNAN
ncbi:short-chain dehydrogenase/reductase SDR [Paludibacter propionicigenes WB4]|uniref:Short-chain dehydrogenase/reductase SDR n=1 Tax=Paludibacter propionicigenes (strain DSM 17365 / JCM 13257 / WB4) TaxID=694427 RepID=E4T346_PALPW|nr:SDR family NAD(P)-dependent oxidoreductase [Paludibacter propionicigenes]ADQ79140.1 short-chain dehydrogenase/reductase SDR [Paludibacter propionicigenes WB4]